MIWQLTVLRRNGDHLAVFLMKKKNKKNNKVKASTRSEDERKQLAWNKHWNEDTVATKVEGQG